VTTSDQYGSAAASTVGGDDPDEEEVGAAEAHHEEMADEDLETGEEQNRVIDARDQDNPDDHRGGHPSET
jgi:hypothetical protein